MGLGTGLGMGMPMGIGMGMPMGMGLGMPGMGVYNPLLASSFRMNPWTARMFSE
ncbi:hypothetical protein DPMN_186955 [Dreissena polymorpha]|uniref:Uncharacterized protein n=1 Tax=Dreissena polymorpha TaxID=45954 RepID=A0A9D4DN42_DREPO|nr:hypothetical protein DPMN_186955 [Dreissena polymorpha]